MPTIAASYEYDNEGQFRSIPQLTVVVKGKKLYDPKKMALLQAVQAVTDMTHHLLLNGQIMQRYVY